MGDALADDVGVTIGQTSGHFLGVEVAAGVLFLLEVALFLLGLLVLVAEAVVGVTALHQQLGVLGVEGAALGLDVGAHGAAHVGTFVPGQAAGAHGIIDDLGGVLHQTALVGVLNAEDELAAGVAGDEVGVQGGAEIAHVHVARGRGGEAGAHPVVGDTGFHIVKPLLIESHVNQNLQFTVCPHYSLQGTVWQEADRLHKEMAGKRVKNR